MNSAESLVATMCELQMSLLQVLVKKKIVSKAELTKEIRTVAARTAPEIELRPSSDAIKAIESLKE